MFDLRFNGSAVWNGLNSHHAWRHDQISLTEHVRTAAETFSLDITVI